MVAELLVYRGGGTIVLMGPFKSGKKVLVKALQDFGKEANCVVIQATVDPEKMNASLVDTPKGKEAKAAMVASRRASREDHSAAAKKAAERVAETMAAADGKGRRPGGSAARYVEETDEAQLGFTAWRGARQPARRGRRRLRPLAAHIERALAAEQTLMTRGRRRRRQSQPGSRPRPRPRPPRPAPAGGWGADDRQSVANPASYFGTRRDEGDDDDRRPIRLGGDGEAAERNGGSEERRGSDISHLRGKVRLMEWASLLNELLEGSHRIDAPPPPAEPALGTTERAALLQAMIVGLLRHFSTTRRLVYCSTSRRATRRRRRRTSTSGRGGRRAVSREAEKERLPVLLCLVTRQVAGGRRLVEGGAARD